MFSKYTFNTYLEFLKYVSKFVLGDKLMTKHKEPRCKWSTYHNNLSVVVANKDVEDIKCVQNWLLSWQPCALSLLCRRFCDLVRDGESLCVSQQVFLLIGRGRLAGRLAGPEYQRPLARLSALSLRLGGNTRTQLHAKGLVVAD